MNEKFEMRSSPVWNELSATSEAVINYAKDVLALGKVDIKIHDVPTHLKDLPVEILEAFDDLKTPADKIENIDLQLEYNKGDMLFFPKALQINLDNKYAMSFFRTQIKHPRENSQGEGNMYLPVLIRPDGNVFKKFDNTRLVKEELFYELLTDLDINIPTTRQRAEWKEIQSILQFSKRWTAKNVNRTAIGPLLFLRTEEREDGVGIKDFEVDLSIYENMQKEMPISMFPQGSIVDSRTDEVTEITDDSGLGNGSVREINIDVEECEDMAFTPTKTTRITFFIDENSNNPRFEAIREIPIVYTTDFMGEKPEIRHELNEGNEVLINVDILRFFQKAIANARSQSDF